jgi:hypothetical protein
MILVVAKASGGDEAMQLGVRSPTQQLGDHRKAKSHSTLVQLGKEPSGAEGLDRGVQERVGDGLHEEVVVLGPPTRQGELRWSEKAY